MNNKSTFKAFYKALPRVDENRCICIISHNVFWFQGAPFATDQPPAPRPEIVAQLCSLYREINPDVICLQELQSLDAVEAVAKELGMQYIFRAGGNYSQYGGVVLSRWSMEEIALPHDFVPDRILIIVKISPENKQSFELANIHLPSNRQRGAEGAQKQRLREISLVLQHADVLLGDFNELPVGQCAALLQEKDFVDASPACSAEELPSNLGTYRGDQIWLSSESSKALQGYFIVPEEQLTIDDGEEKFLSDHFPVGCWLR